MTSADVVAEWTAKWLPVLESRFDRVRALRDSSYAQGWLFVEATPEAEADLSRRLSSATDE